MILNIIDNSKILQNNFNVYLPNFTVLTGGNGSGKTQLLEFIRDYAGSAIYNLDAHGNFLPDEHGNFNYDEFGSVKPSSYYVSNDDSSPIRDVIYSFPGLKKALYEHDGNYQQPLIESIRQQWESLAPMVSAYRFIKRDVSNDDQMELNSLNSEMTKLVAAATVPNNGMHALARQFDLHQFQQLRRLAESCSKTIDLLTLTDFIIFYQIPLELFSAAIDLLFHQFYLKREKYPTLTVDVTPPWVTFNEILDRAQFKYRAEYTVSTSEDIPMPVKLVDKTNAREVHFQNLSSGETTILALIFVLYNSSNKGHFPQMILFDEPDAHLHPSLTQVFLDVIENVLVKEQQVKVVLTTHSPSTVALADEETIYSMNRELGKPEKASKQSAINILSNGLASLTIEESSYGLAYNIRTANKHILFTEGITDKIILEMAWAKLYNNRVRNFYIQDCFSASFLGTLFNQGDQSPDGIFIQFPDLKMIALFDFDQAGYSNWNRGKKFSDFIEQDPRKSLVRFNGSNGYLMLLPVPEILEISDAVIISGNQTYGDRSYLTIESLFFQIDELRECFEEIKLAGGSTTYVIKGNNNKRVLTEKLTELPIQAFENFKPLFEKIEEILC